jgi:hypothetical protein
MDLKDTSFVYTTDGMSYDPDTLYKALEWLHHSHHIECCPCHTLPAISEYLENTTAKPAKAISKYFADHYGIKLATEQRTEFGNRVSCARMARTYKVVLTLGCQGNSDDYYHERSCWWGSYSISRDFVEFNGGGAVRVYTIDGDIQGRVWFLPFDDGIVLFNSYGLGELQHVHSWGPIVAQLLDTDFCKSTMEILNNRGHLYINSEVSAYVGPKIVPISTKHCKIRLSIPDRFVYSPARVCSHCERVFSDGGDVRLLEFNDQYVCGGCLDEYYAYDVIDRMYKPKELMQKVWGMFQYSTARQKWFSVVPSDAVYIDSMGYCLPDCLVDDVYGTQHLVGSGTYFRCDFSDKLYPRSEWTRTVLGAVAKSVVATDEFKAKVAEYEKTQEKARDEWRQERLFRSTGITQKSASFNFKPPSIDWGTLFTNFVDDDQDHS